MVFAFMQNKVGKGVAITVLALLTAVSTAGNAAAAEVTTAGAVNWSSNTTADAATSDTIKFGGDHLVTITTGENIGRTGGASAAVTATSIDMQATNTTDATKGILATGTINIYGSIIGSGDVTLHMGEVAGTNGAGAATHVSIYGTAVATFRIAGAGNGTAINTVTLGDGTNAVTNTASIDMVQDAGGKMILNISEGVTYAGAITDTADGGTANQINVTGNATISGSIVLDQSTGTDDSSIVITDGKTLTLASTGAITLTGDELVLGTSAAGATLKVTGAKTITAAKVVGSADGKGILDIDANVTIVGAVGDTAKDLESISIKDGTTLTVNGAAIAALTITLGDSTAGGTLKTITTGATITGAVEGSAADKGTLDIDIATTIATTVGATNGILAVDIAAGIVLTQAGTVLKAKTITMNDATSELKVTGAATVTGNIVTSTDNEGILNVDQSFTMAGNVGSSASLDLNVADIANSKIMTFEGSEYHVVTTTLNNAASKIIFSTDATASGIFVGASGGVGILDVDADVTFLGVIGTNAMANITVAADKTVTLKGATVASTAFTLEGANDTSTIVIGGQTTNVESTTAVTGNIVATGVGGVLTLMGDPSDATGHSITGSVGATGAANYLGTINVGNNSLDADTSDVHLVTINTYADTLNFAATVNGTTTVGGTIQFTAASTTAVTLGAVTTEVAGDGTLHYLSGTGAITGVITGNVGSPTAALASVLIDGTNAATGIDFGGNVYATSMVLTHATQADATFSGTTGSTVSSTITAGANGNGDIHISNTSAEGVTFTSTVGAADSIKTSNHATGTKTTFKDVVNAQTTTLTGTADVTFEKDANIFDTALTLSTAGTGTIRLGTGVAAGEIALQTAALTNITAGTKIYAPANHTTGSIIFVDDTDNVVTTSGCSIGRFYNDGFSFDRLYIGARYHSKRSW